MLFQNTRSQMFFKILRSAAENAVDAANLLSQLLAEPTRSMELAPALKDLEKKGDELTHDMFALINKSFVTPMDREDLAAVATAIDSVVDGMEAAAARFEIYKVRETDRFLKEFGATLRAQCSELVAAIDMVAGGKFDQINNRLIMINQLENVGDDTLRSALSTLYDQAAVDPVRFIVMKEIYDTLEGATDRAEDVADTLAGAAMKQG